ncbi:MAG: hypothetical protein JST86_20580 [Bacteroidetes bacterium]|nr:hypothetical protein [Bacteroidota bacterium]
MMKPVVEPFEMKQRTFMKWLFAFFLVLGIWAFIIMLPQPGYKKWLLLSGAVVIFGFGWWSSGKHKINADQHGLMITDVFKTKTIAWGDITSLHYHTVYHGHGVQLKLTVTYGTPSKARSISVKQYPSKQMKRFFEILYEQCPAAAMNLHFIKMATGAMSWKDKLKMY